MEGTTQAPHIYACWKSNIGLLHNHINTEAGSVSYKLEWGFSFVFLCATNKNLQTKQ